MDPTLAALIGTIVGAVLGFLGTFYATWFQVGREERRLAKDRLRADLYALQDALEEVFRQYDAAMKAPPTVAPHPGVTSALIRINMQAIRVGDQPLSNAVSAILEKLAEARKADAAYAKGEAFNAALDLLSSVHQRIGELLHTGAKVDLDA